MKYELNPYHLNITDQELLDDLKKVALMLGKQKVPYREYNDNGKFNSNTLIRRFGSWNNVLEKAGLQINVQQNITDEELFKNIEEVWINIGRQPLKNEMKKQLSKYSVKPY